MMSTPDNHPHHHTNDHPSGGDGAESGRRGRALWPVGEDGRPQLRAASDPETNRALTAMIDARGLPDLYVRDGHLVMVELVSGTAPAAGDDDALAPLAANRLTPPRLASALADHVTITDPKGAAITPRRDLLAEVLSRRTWPGLPALRGLITAPVLRPDGTLLQDPGYDPATGYYLTTRTTIDRVPETPTSGEVDEAVRFFLDVFLADFPWRSDADRANYLALLITPLIRPYTRALAPFAVIDATMPGSGKTILTSCIGLLVGQRVVTWPDDDDAELRKTVTTVLADQVGAIVFDNLTEGAVIRSPVLARLITERTWTDRRLGSNAAATFEQNRLWLATGNNLHTGGDMATRTVWVRLDPNTPAPEARTGFSIPNLDTWILDPTNQATVLRHALILVVDWCRHGAPTSTTVPAMRQFSTWARHLGGFLDHHGIPGFLTNHHDNQTRDDDHQEWRAFLHTWHHLFGPRPVTANELVRHAEPEPGRPDPWRGTFPTTPSGRPLTVKALGRRLTGQVDRWRTDIVLRSATDPTNNARTYWVHNEDPQTKPGNPGKCTMTSVFNHRVSPGFPGLKAPPGKEKPGNPAETRQHHPRSHPTYRVSGFPGLVPPPATRDTSGEYAG